MIVCSWNVEWAQQRSVQQLKSFVLSAVLHQQKLGVNRWNLLQEMLNLHAYFWKFKLQLIIVNYFTCSTECVTKLMDLLFLIMH